MTGYGLCPSIPLSRRGPCFSHLPCGSKPSMAAIRNPPACAAHHQPHSIRLWGHTSMLPFLLAPPLHTECRCLPFDGMAAPFVLKPTAKAPVLSLVLCWMIRARYCRERSKQRSKPAPMPHPLKVGACCHRPNRSESIILGCMRSLQLCGKRRWHAFWPHIWYLKGTADDCLFCINTASRGVFQVISM